MRYLSLLPYSLSICRLRCRSNRHTIAHRRLYPANAGFGHEGARAELRNPDTLALKLFGARERQVLSEVGQPIFTDLDFTDPWNKLGGQKSISYICSPEHAP